MNRKTLWYLLFVMTAIVLAAGVIILTSTAARDRGSGAERLSRSAELASPHSAWPTEPARDSTLPVVTPVEGPSWIEHLGIADTRETHMGQMGGDKAAPGSRRKEPSLAEEGEYSARMHGIMRRMLPLLRSDSRRASELMNESFVLTGADLYRLNCQSCHGPDGKGAPPEIKSLIDPVRGTSPALTVQRMQKLGRSIGRGMVDDLAAQAEKTIRQRLQEGGEKMPPFRHLQGNEVDALLNYLKKLAGLPRSEWKVVQVPQSVARVGEHVVKGTCHTCHDATGPGSGHMMMMSDIIPSLASFPEQESLQNVVRQVEMGSSGMMAMMGGQTMPAFPYLTEEEVAAAYLYLAQYPPRP
jgi:mono/diheme cytochrome c family protein